MITHVTASEETLTGRALVEAGQPVAGSMSRAAATVVFEPESARVQVDDQFAACLRAAADEAAALTVPRERVRAGAALAFAVEYAATLHRNGRRVRSDGWFSPRGAHRPIAAEMTESVVAAARRSTDERWVRHLGYLLAEAAVSADLDAELVRRALRMAESLSWRQLVVLAGVGRRERGPAGDAGGAGRAASGGARGGRPPGGGAPADGAAGGRPAGLDRLGGPRGRHRPAARRSARPAGPEPAPGVGAAPAPDGRPAAD